MAHFAQLDENNVVINVVLIANEAIVDSDGKESEDLGIALCKSIFGEDTNWKQTSYSASFRKNYASIGGTYDPVRGAFIPRKVFQIAVLDEDSCDWIYPPPDGQSYEWDAETSNWKLVTP
jgi:hypothetical protein